MGNGWSVCWRVHDAQFWGVPQRRRRIALVADFGGHTAPEILFERKGVCGDSAESRTAREGTAGDFEGYTYPPVARSLIRRYDGSPCIDRGPNIVCAGFKLGNSEQAHSIGFQEERSPTLNAECGGNKPAICYGIGSFNSAGMLSDNPKAGIYEADTSRTLDLNGGNPACNQGGIARGAHFGQNGIGCSTEDVSYTLNTMDIHAVATFSFGRSDEMQESNIASTQSARQYKCATDLVAAVDCRNGTENPDVNGTPQSKPSGGTSYNLNNTVRNGCSVRRLTPLECERLQGYPDGWTDIPGASDSARYKSLGNSIALPFWRWMLTRMSTYLPADATLGSLFDGIGGFPLIWEEIHGKSSARWASEIEPFPIAVTKMRFKEDEPCKVY